MPVVSLVLNRAAPLASRALHRWRERRRFHAGLGAAAQRKPFGRCLIAYEEKFIAYLAQESHDKVCDWTGDTVATLAQSCVERAIPGADGPTFATHSAYWESSEIVRQCLERGFVVDYVDARNATTLDVTPYDIIIDEWNNLPRWRRTNPGARTLFYATGAQWVFHNMATFTRHEWLKRRRGSVPDVRELPRTASAEAADLISIFGNGFTRDTFHPHTDRVRQLRISQPRQSAVPPTKDWTRAQRSFLYFAGYGWVHKGLDLAVEAFLGMPELSLCIAGPDVAPGSEFMNVYGDALARARNIQVCGFLDVFSERFEQVVGDCGAVLLPSASENGAGSVVQAMHFGLIPIVTESAGLAAEPMQVPINGTSDLELIHAIRNGCRELSNVATAEFAQRSRDSWAYANRNHDRAAYAASLSKVLDELLVKHAGQR